MDSTWLVSVLGGLLTGAVGIIGALLKMLAEASSKARDTKECLENQAYLLTCRNEQLDRARQDAQAARAEARRICERLEEAHAEAELTKSRLMTLLPERDKMKAERDTLRLELDSINEVLALLPRADKNGPALEVDV